MARRRRITRREMKEDKFIIFIYNAWNYISRHTQEIVIGIGIVIVAAVAGYLYANIKQGNEQDAARIYAPAQTAFQQGRFEDAVPVFERIRDEYTGTSIMGESVFKLADAYFQLKKMDEALATYQQYLESYEGDNETLTISARVGIAACIEQQGNYADAAQRYQQLEAQYPRSYLAPRFLLDAGRCYQAANQWDQAKNMYDKIITVYEDSPYVQEAKMALTAL